MSDDDMVDSDTEEQPVRMEPSLEVSEFHLSRNGAVGVNVADLISNSKRLKRVGNLKTQISNAYRRSKVLPTPLHRQAEEQLRRSVAYQAECKELRRWDDFVHLSRVADEISFPLADVDSGDLKKYDGDVPPLVPTTEFELEMAKSKEDSGQTDSAANGAQLSADEKELLQQCSLEEARAALDRLRRYRAMKTYEDAKHRRTKKIKSKRYHRILKQQQRRRLLREFQDLVSTDPTSAVGKLEQLEKDRIVERATLRHTGTGSWARKMMTYAKRDIKVREKIQEQIRFAKDLIAKLGHAQELVDEAKKSDDDGDYAFADEANLKSTTAEAATGSTEAMLSLQATAKPAVLEDRMDFGDQEALMAEAFEDDDVVTAAGLEATTTNDEDAAQHPDTGLAGWNSWIGPDIVSRPKSSVRPAPPAAIKQRAKRRVFFNDQADRTIRDKQLDRAPFPFVSGRAFETTLSNPVGRDWNPAAAHQLLTRSVVTTRMGAVIRPANRKLAAAGARCKQ